MQSRWYDGEFDEQLTNFGWAPGGYMQTCNDCEVQHIADKRAWRCKSCAEKMLAAKDTVSQLLQAVEKPISYEELLRRGASDDLTDLFMRAIGEKLYGELTPDEALTLGYGVPCPCGERGLMLGEKTCSNCDRCKECCDSADEPCSCEGCSCK